MHTKFYTLAILCISCMVFLSACSGPAIPTSAPSIQGLAGTLAAETLAAQHGRYSPFLATPTPPSAQSAAMPQAPVNISPPKAERTPASQVTPFRNHVRTEADLESCSNAAEFVQDITIPDGTELKPNQRFTKTWRFKNIGTCTWGPEYAVVFVWGDRMSEVDSILLGRRVAPGESIDISIPMMAPKLENYYQANWMFQDTQGNTFGTGYKGRNFFWVAISIGGSGLGKNGRKCVGGSGGGGGG